MRPPVDTGHRRDRLISFVAILLPILNQAIYWPIDQNGGAHGHAWPIVAAVAALEIAAIGWFCARRTDRPVVFWTLCGFFVDAVVSVALLYLVTIVALIAAYGGGGDGH